jgi:hypothetical protein
MDNSLKNIVASVKALNSMDPRDPSIVRLASDLANHAGSATNENVDADFLSNQVKRLAAAAATPAENYSRIMSIAGDLEKAIEISRRPQNAAIRPKIAGLVEKIAGIFAECDTAADLSKHSLEEIQAAVHKLYRGGKMNDPETYNFQSSGRGHHPKK